MDRLPEGEPGDGAPRAWSVVVRLLHGTLAVIVVFNLVRDDGDRVHRTAGYVAVGVVVARWLWGLVARGNERLAALRPSPTGALRYLRACLRGNAPHHAGHDPLGLWMVWLMWTLILLLGFTGWISRLDAFWGDDFVHDLHAWLADALLVSVVLHLCGVAAMSWHWRENLPARMFAGRRRSIDRRK